MAVKIILGAQWGDEGKGKLVDVLAGNADIVARYQGGANAGHTVYISGKKHVLHLLPSGILRNDKICLIGNGVVLDPDALEEELQLMDSLNISTRNRLFISDRAHIIFPYHKYLDTVSEKALSENKIGTTGRGIGPAYTDKICRQGIRATDLFDSKLLKEKIEFNLEKLNKTLIDFYHVAPVDAVEIYEFANKSKSLLEKYIADTGKIIYDSWRDEKNILLEGAQGSLLDIDFGTYPFVTSSNPVSGGAVTGTGLPPTAIDEVVGVFKAYTTRVGSGPFPTELNCETGELLRKEGKEFGATTGRPRRCGWLDLVAAEYAKRINGLTALAITKLDVLGKFSEIKIGTKYEFNGKSIAEFPASLTTLEQCNPAYDTLPGWNSDISGARAFAELPKNAKYFIEYIENALKLPVKYISVGPDREQIILK